MVFKNRTDLKYLMHHNDIHDLIDDIRNDYFVVSINNTIVNHYHTFYYDFNDDSCYLKHHNKNYPRFKVRKRFYSASGDQFLEVKRKSNKLITSKQRIKIEQSVSGITDSDLYFLNENLDRNAQELDVVMESDFDRITLVRKDFKERITIDRSLSVSNRSEKFAFENVVILEVKNEFSDHHSPVEKALKNIHIYPTGFSKYCIGRAILNPDLKRNRFKMRILKLNKLMSRL